jgi:hypothetical protein
MTRFVILFSILCVSLPVNAQTSIEKVKNPPLHAGASREFSGDFETIVKYAKTALTDASLEMEFIERVDEKNYMLLGKRRASGFSWGEMVRIVVTIQSNDIETIVHVYTKKRVGVNATAKATYSNTIFSSIESQLELDEDNVAVVARSTVEEPVAKKITTSAPNNYNTEHRTALVIGNAHYRKSPLKNPVNDALAISK